MSKVKEFNSPVFK